MEVYKRLRTSLVKGGFQLPKWICNSENVKKHMSPEGRSGAKIKKIEVDLPAFSFLGLQRIVKSDSLEIRRGVKKDYAQKISISHILCVWSIGLVLSLHIEDAVVAQTNPEETWAFVGWKIISRMWNEFEGLGIGVESDEWDGYQGEVVIGISENAETVDLHIFADASLEAVCIIAQFWHQQTGELAYVVRKCRVAAMKQQSITRLEQAATYGTRSKQLIVDKHGTKIRETFCWTDSKTVLQWL